MTEELLTNTRPRMKHLYPHERKQVRESKKDTKNLLKVMKAHWNA